MSEPVRKRDSAPRAGFGQDEGSSSLVPMLIWGLILILIGMVGAVYFA